MTGPLIAFHLGPLTIYWYGIILMTGMLVGGTVAAFEAKRHGVWLYTYRNKLNLWLIIRANQVGRICI